MIFVPALLLLMQTDACPFTTGSGLKVCIDSIEFVKSGDNATLNCSVVTGGLADNIYWYNTADVNTKMKVSKSSVAWDSLVLHNVTLKDASTYRCQANKGQEVDSDEYTLDVYAKPEVQLSPLRIGELISSVREDCTATGYPKPNITWYFNGKVLKNGAMFNSVVIKQTTPSPSPRTSERSALALLVIVRNHSGNYTCEATNEMGSSRQTLQLLLKGEPKVSPGGIRVIRESGNATLACEGEKLLHHDSDVVFSWDFEGTTIPKNSAHYKQSTNRVPWKHIVHMKLAILNASTGDAGLYNCHVKNSVKQSSGKVRLVVVSKDIKPKARIVGPNEKAVKLGSNVTLWCEISYPAYLKTVNMSWSNSTAKYNVHEKNAEDLTSRSFVLSLDFVNITRQDLGSYTCQINTSIGSSVARLQVILLQGVETLSQDTSDNSLVMLALIVTAGTVSGLTGAIWAFRLWRKKNNQYLGPINNKEFKYDVFITFSGKDFAWVKAKLIPLLEKHSVEYCIHNRDFELGKTILDNMADSVYKSKKVLAVMSRNYMDSKYCRGELEMALYRSTEMGDSSVIVIRIDNIEKDKLPKALRNRTFLDYYDETERKTWAARIMKHLTQTSIKI